ncbi:MAG: hypothetical protein D6763_04270 [Alphaproteobacteria bacterium]|nr:MAG: hypothetical protein D6763_04270 [Alphaproteobacteria bacterium]
MTRAGLSQSWHFLRNLRRQQMMWRAAYLIKRRFNWHRAPEPSISPGLQTKLPETFLPARPTATRIGANEIVFSFLNQSVTSDIPVDWESLESTQSHLWAFNLHYMEYLEALDTTTFQRLVTDWIAGNPVSRQSSWRTSWSAYTISLRTVVWMQQIARRKPSLNQEFLDRTLRSLYQQIHYLERNLELDLGGNHLLKNIKALLWAGQFFCGNDAIGWHRKAKHLLARELKEQFLPDGMHYERSPAYHGQVFADLLDCWAVIGEDDIGLERVIHEAAEALAATTHPDGLPSLFNDGGLHMAYAPSDLLDTYESLFNRRPQRHTTFALPHAGYYGYRSGRFYVLADCGDIGPDYLVAHGHGDILAFELTVEGRRFVVDQGVFEYAPGDKRDFSRATSSHNTVEINGASQCDFFGSFRVGRRAHARCLGYTPHAEGFTLTGTHDGYDHLKGRPRHTRTFEISKVGVRITDDISSGHRYPVKASLLLGPDVKVSRQEKGFDLTQGDTKFHLESSAPLAIEDTVWFPDFGIEKPTKRIIFDYGHSPTQHHVSLIMQS